MSVAELRALYDQEMRRMLTWHDSSREALPHVIRHVALDGTRGFIVYSDLDAESADDEIARQLEYFRERNIPFEWKLFSHDRPDDLQSRLARHGLVAEEQEAIMVLDLAVDPPLLAYQSTVEVRQLRELAELSVLAAIEEQVWGHPFDDLVARLARDMSEVPDDVAIYLASVDGVPAATAWLYLHPGTHFASIWGGSTLPHYRKRGLYTALLATRARAAQQRGFRYLTVDAGPMSRPILASHGFVTIALSYPCAWQPEPHASRA